VTTPRFRLGFLLIFLVVLALAACAQGQADDLAASTSPASPHPSASLADAASATAPADAAADGDGDVLPAQPDAALESGSPDAALPDAALPDAALPDAGPPPVVDGVVGPSEYGVHVDGQNQQTSATAGNVWYMTWSDSTLYVAVTAANVAEGVVLYLDHAPLTPSTSGSNADGSLVGLAYDNTRGTLPFRADFVAYVKSTYQEHRSADGANGWSAPVTSGLTVQGTGAVREIAIPWTTIRAGGRPPAFSWLGYATSAGGYVYGQLPVGNPGGTIGLNAAFGVFYKVSDTTPGAGTKPFASKLVP
jgi:hypothetical protein